MVCGLRLIYGEKVRLHIPLCFDTTLFIKGKFVLRQLFYLAFWFISLLVSPITAAKSPADEVVGAACIVRVDDKLVLVHEILTRKLSLPGGLVESGEDPAIAAQRETWEETGLVVSIKKELGRADNTVYYDCVSDSDIVSFQFNNVYNGYELPMWFAPHYGVEISSAMLVNPSNIPLADYRFPEQTKWIQGLVAQASNQPIKQVGSLVKAAPDFNQVELNWILQLQYVISELPEEIKNIVRPLILSGNLLAEPFLFVLLFPLLCLVYGKSFVTKVLFATLTTALLSFVAQQGFALPHPHVYLPTLKLVETYGFGLPSTSAALWVTIGVLVIKREQSQRVHALSLALMGCLAWLSMAKFYTGTAFLLDIVSGVLLGFLTAWHVIRLENKPNLNVEALFSSRGIWVALLLICGAIAFVWPSLTLGYWFTLVLATLVLFLPWQGGTAMVKFPTAIYVVLVLLAMNLSISYLATLAIHSSILSLAVEFIRYPVLVALFVTLLRRKPVSVTVP